MSILRWDPMDDFDSIRREMSRLMDAGMSPFRSGRMSRGERGAMALPLDAYSTDEEIVITAAVPGLDPDEIELTLEDQALTIRGEFRAPIENVNYLFQERPYGPFSRSVTINVPIDADRAEAKFDKGILTIILPKAEHARAKVIQVKTE
jgi:HSP20 family protein